MKLYNQNTNKIENSKTITTLDGTMYVDRLTEKQLNDYDYYKIEYQSPPNRRYYTSVKSSSLVGNKYVVGYTKTERPLDEVKKSMLKDLSKVYKEKQIRPRVTTSLGFDVDGGYNDIVNFEIGKKFALPQIKDADNIKHDATSADYDTIINEIQMNGISLFNTKDTKESEINALATIAECEKYENEPYDYTITAEDVANDIDGTLVLGQAVTRYRNNVKDW
jgi:hypothetical protein